MLSISISDISRILYDFQISENAVSFSEMQRYDYEKGDQKSKNVRLIIKVMFDAHPPVVMRFKNEDDVTLESVEAQSRFAALLLENGVETPMQFRSDGNYARPYHINGYDVIVTVEIFADGEVKYVNAEIAEKTGSLLANTHNISEMSNAHIQNRVLFDPLSENDLFDFSLLEENEQYLNSVDSNTLHEIISLKNEYLSVISPLEKDGRYAVQGDISNCNLYMTENGQIGVFDFNRCGDNVLFFDAVMQAVFESRLMDYDDDDPNREKKLLSAFLNGYHKIRQFTDKQKSAYPYLYALIDAFWASDIIWNDNSLKNLILRNDQDKIRFCLHMIKERLCAKNKIPI